MNILLADWYFYRPKAYREAIVTTGIHPVQKYHVKMYVQVQRTAKVLNQGHGTGLCRRLCEARFVG